VNLDAGSYADTLNSTAVPLGASGVFTGSFVNVLPFSSVSIIVVSDRASAANGLVLQWSTDAINVDDEQRYVYAGSASEQGKFVYAPVRAKFFRVQYTNTSLAQTVFRLQTLLRRQVVQSSLSPAGIDITTEQDSTISNAILVAQRLSTPSDLVHLKTDDNAFLITADRQNSSITQNETTVPASLSSVDLDFFGIFGPTRVHFHVFNDTTRGNLHLRFGSSGATLTAFNVRVPPQHSWELPQSWGRWGGGIKGIWDVADGNARCTEWF
jgi:hypothetical protein